MVAQTVNVNTIILALFTIVITNKSAPVYAKKTAMETLGRRHSWTESNPKLVTNCSPYVRRSNLPLFAGPFTSEAG